MGGNRNKSMLFNRFMDNSVYKIISSLRRCIKHMVTRAWLVQIES
jgi:hypothetical protein